ncbi:GDSL-type esterase/lipase family protein [Sorangium sp. So ce1000]|uniref:GDSL-type esterase/lipase family protein n=1 Tax=Sorangium sp. So ce1000 TaxID=3133325 RepID=UPI003F5F0297
MSGASCSAARAEVPERRAAPCRDPRRRAPPRPLSAAPRRVLVALLAAAALGCSSTREHVAPPAPEVGSAPSARAHPPGLAEAPAPAGERAAAPPLAEAAPPRPPELDLLRPADGPYAHFFAALRALEQGRRRDHVRVAWLGDSHAAADFWSGAVRAALQRRFGDGGLGFMHLGYAAYRHDGARLTADGKWRPRPKTPGGSAPIDDGVFGLGGILFGAHQAPVRAEITVTSAGPPPRLLWDVCFRPSAPTDEVAVTIEGGPSEVLRAAAGDAPGALQHAKLASVGAMKLGIAPSGGAELCGLVVERDPEAGPGVVLDTLGINGARLATPLRWSELGWAAELARRSPELVVLEYGTNEAGDVTTDPSLYAKQLAELLARARRVEPDVDCLVLAPTDRRDAPERTPVIRDVLRDAAREGGCAFWDTYEAMGGRGSIDAWYRERPPRASRDGVHLTFRGYRELGVKLSNDILERYRP